MINASVERCFSFINSQTVSRAKAAGERNARRAVTISRQAGSGAFLVAERLANYLQQHLPRPGVGWTVFDRELMGKVLADHNLPTYFEKYLPEDRISEIEDTLADLFGVRPPARTVVEQTAETMLGLVELGGVILIGRAGNIVTAKMSGVLHVRLVAPLDDRVERICRADHKTLDEARKFCIEEEQARARYLKTYFNADINDPLQYHLILNTSLVGCDGAARLIGDALMQLKA